MSDQALRDMILQCVPADGAGIGNQALLERLAESGMDVGEAQYRRVRDALVAEGLLVTGRGRGGSVKRAETVPADAFNLDAQEIPEQAKQFAARRQGMSLQEALKAKAQPKAGKKGEEPQVLSYRHGDKRKNNPHVGMVDTSSDGVEEKSVWAYDPHLDPALNFDSARARIENLIDDALATGDESQMRAALEQLKRMQTPYLNWSGKAERTSFEVDLVSLHVHERIDPATILAAVQKRLKYPSPAGGKGASHPSPLGRGAGVREFQPDLFSAPFENLPLREAIDFYKHDRDWANRLIAGDSLLVMNSLLQKESMAGQVQMIYIDPPYGIKYGSNFQPFVNKRDVKDRKDEDLTQEPEMIKAFRDTWELGIHSYLTYLRDRLLLAKELLHESGSVFVQISEENLHIVRNVLDDVFGKNSFAGLITFRKTSGLTADRLAQNADYLIWYAKDIEKLKFRTLFAEKGLDSDLGFYSYVQLPNGTRRRIAANETSKPGYRPYTVSDLTSSHDYSLGKVDFEFEGIIYSPSARFWTTSPDGMSRLGKVARIHKSTNSVRFVRFLDDFPVQPLTATWTDTITGQYSDPRIYAVQTATKVVERCMLMTTDPGDLVLDPTCGSGTTAFVAEKWGRRWITCDTSRVAVTLAKQRLMTASYDYFELKYPHDGLRGGFIYKTVPHVTLKSIANNPEIDEIYARMHPAIEAALDDLNKAVVGWADDRKPNKSAEKNVGLRSSAQPTNSLQEWDVPFDFPEDWPEAARKPFDAFHAARQAMQRKMDDSIAAHADQETLYDQPKPSKTKLRITGPFTVEAVPFPTVLGLEPSPQPSPTGRGGFDFEADVAVARSGETSRQAQWRDELLKTGIRGKGGQKLKLADLEPLPGARYIHAVGTVADEPSPQPLSQGERGLQRVAVSFGPEHAALEQRQVEIAMREAGELFPLPRMLVFCAFTFDPEAAKDIDNIKGITALKVQMNTDLLTEDLKKARANNESFWLMGQPDVEVRKLPSPPAPLPKGEGSKDWYQVEVHGFDYFDTTSGELKSGGKKQIAMWALDTDYDNRSLYPKQVFFPMAGATDGWNKLKKDIKAELNEELLGQFHGTVSLPFEAGENRCVAVKIVDDRGIESLKVMNLD